MMGLATVVPFENHPLLANICQLQGLYFPSQVSANGQYWIYFLFLFCLLQGPLSLKFEKCKCQLIRNLNQPTTGSCNGGMPATTGDRDLSVLIVRDIAVSLVALK